MKLNPKYSYEFNCVLNEGFDEMEQIKNFASTLSDKDRFLILLPLIEKNSKLMEEKLGFELPEIIDFYVVRAEKFKSFSEPIVVEYSLLPQEMILFLLKEVLKTVVTIRFPDEVVRDQYINSFIDYLAINGDWGQEEMVKYTKNIHEESQKLYPEYELISVDFENKIMKDYATSLFEDEMDRREAVENKEQ